MIPLFAVYMAWDAPDRVAETLRSGYVGEGPVTAAFEQALADELGLPGIQAVNSCTAALDLALHLAGVGPGDTVVSTPLTCTATSGAIVRRGARILWADVDPETGCIDAEDAVARAAGTTAKAIVAVDWAGRSCDYRTLRHAGVPIIEDAAHRPYVDPRNHGDYVCWSFGPIKHLTCGGYGGALLVPESQRDRARLLRWHGLDRTSSADFRCAQMIDEAGYRYHLTDDLASVGLANLPYLGGVVAKHRQNAAYYDRVLANVPGVMLPPPDPACDYWLYDVRLTGDRDGFIAFLAEKGIAASPVHRRNDVHPAYRFPSGSLPGVDAYDASHAAIPVGWWLTESDREKVARAVISWSLAHAAAELTRALVAA